MRDWLNTTLARISGRSDLAGAIRYALSRWEALTRYDKTDDSFRATINLAAAIIASR